MRMFARLEVVRDDQPEDEPSAVERIVSDTVDVALWLRARLAEAEEEYGPNFEADLHLEPIPRED